ncbi:type II toxin-antitoxin system death-on-curing family toxin [Empedobacter brevis]|uniref:type II toxin-antitoxin system death-on-curing family toxin n=1 Tax=Empedobacter brevis TaxID=247 RepID=UPI0039AEB8A6
MDEILPELKKEYDRAIEKIDDSEFQSRNLISFSDVIKSHYLIADFFMKDGEQTICGVKDINLLGSALGRQTTGFNGQLKWKKEEEICATLFYGIIKNHAFHDANKRTALLTLIYHLHRLGRTITDKQKVFEDLAVNIAENNLEKYPIYKKKFKHLDDAEILFIADFLKKKTRKIDKRYYPITYREFDKLLKKHNCYIDVLNGGFANIMKPVVVKRFLKKDKIEYKSAIQIGFNGWDKKINLKAVKESLKACNLTDEYGIDSQSFYNGVEPLHSLINEYQGPLRRLKDR